MRLTDWDAAYSNRGSVPNFQEIVDDWKAASVAFRAESEGNQTLSYGSGERHIYDLFLPETGVAHGLVIYIHGGYWMAFDKAHSSQCALGPTERGFAVAVLSYDLCPDVTIPEIAFQCASCVAHAARRIDGPIVVAGHSAGGHLATYLGCEEGPLYAHVAERLARTVPISGLFDLRPLMMTAMNDTLGIDDLVARRTSPALLTPLPHVDHRVFCGGDELAEFRRQSQLITNIWTGLGIDIEYHELAGINHFTIPNELADPHSTLTRACVLD